MFILVSRATFAREILNFWLKYRKFILFSFNFVTRIADSTIDVAAIFGVYETEDEEELKFINNMNDMFFTFVKTGTLPKGEDLSFEKMYLVDSDNILSKDNSLPLGKSSVLPKVKNMSFVFWMNFNSSSSSVS